jgi:anti-anti-sigma regulatory factor
LQSYLIGQLVMLHNRIHKQGGVLRLVGLSDRNHEILKICRLDAHFPKYQSCRDAVLCTGAAPAPR